MFRNLWHFSLLLLLISWFFYVSISTFCGYACVDRTHEEKKQSKSQWLWAFFMYLFSLSPLVVNRFDCSGLIVIREFKMLKQKKKNNKTSRKIPIFISKTIQIYNNTWFDFQSPKVSFHFVNRTSVFSKPMSNLISPEFLISLWFVRCVWHSYREQYILIKNRGKMTRKVREKTPNKSFIKID